MTTPRPLRSSILAALVLAGLLCAAPRVHAQTASQLYNEAVQAYGAGDPATAKQKLRLSLEVDKNFRPAAALLNKITLEEKQGGAPETGVPVKALGRMVVPVEFKDTTLSSAIEFIRQQIDTQSGGKVQVNFVSKLPPDLANKRISLHLDRVPVTEMLKYLGEQAGVNFQVQQFAIVVVPAGSEPEASPTPAT